jgi:protein-tyrosine phosphatase
MSEMGGSVPLLPARFNLRDLGGLETVDGRRVRDARLYRGASLHQLEGEQLAATAALGWGTAIDLRTASEVAYGTYSHASTATHHLPVFEQTPIFKEPIEDIATALAETYMRMLEEGGSAIATGLELLCDPSNYPAVVYCAAGKDRTGVFCAIVLHLIGVRAEGIAADYALSDGPAQALRDWRAGLAPERRDPVPAGIYRAPQEAMELFFEAVERRFGAIEGYLGELGVAVDEATHGLESNLLTAGSGR